MSPARIDTFEELMAPGALLEGSGAVMCHVKVRSVAVAEAPDVEALIRDSLHERHSARGPATGV